VPRSHFIPPRAAATDGQGPGQLTRKQGPRDTSTVGMHQMVKKVVLCSR
jgi:hypothetical protein